MDENLSVIIKDNIDKEVRKAMKQEIKEYKKALRKLNKLMSKRTITKYDLIKIIECEEKLTTLVSMVTTMLSPKEEEVLW